MKKELKQDTTSLPHSGTENEERWLAFCQPFTELFSEAWRDIPNDGLFSLIEGVWNGSSTFTQAAIVLTSDFREHEPGLSESDRFSLVSGVAFGLMLSVGDEVIRRLGLAETKGGRLARKFALKPEDFTKQDMKDLARAVQFKTRYNPDGLGDKGERRKRSSEENASIIYVACARVLNQETIPTANTKEGLQKLMSGWFNGIPRKADNMLREEIRKNTIRQKKIIQVGDPEDEYGNTAPNTVADFPDAGGEGWRLDVRLQNAESDQVLLDEFRYLDTLTPEERQVIELLRQGQKQTQIAAKLTVSQPRISQLKKSAIRKMQARKNVTPPPGSLLA